MGKITGGYARYLLTFKLAAHINTAAHVWCFYMFYVYIYEWFFFYCVSSGIYSQSSGLELHFANNITSHCHHFHAIPEDIIRTPASLWLVLPSGKPKRRSKQRTRKSKETTT